MFKIFLPSSVFETKESLLERKERENFFLAKLALSIFQTFLLLLTTKIGSIYFDWKGKKIEGRP